LHGHGAKAGVFVRARRGISDAIRVYTPHGGSLHYPLSTAKGTFYRRVERALMDRTELFLFESAFARNTYQRTIGIPKELVRCVFNGVTAKEFDPLVVADDATDVVYVGEFRHIKGADIAIDAVARLRATGRSVTLTLAGDGDEMPALQAQCERLNLKSVVRFLGHVPARTGFAQGRLLVVPSRGDSMPYVVIEAAAAGIPMLAARVGGIPEILGGDHPSLVQPESASALADAIAGALNSPATVLERAKALRERVFQHFSQNAMVDGVLAAYTDAFAER
jgi:glycosyltransferase involved in cell wall biosynthesis